MKHFLVTTILILYITSCSKENDDPIYNGNLITTSGLNFLPEVLNCNVGDTIFFELGSTHNAVEVSEENYNANNSRPLENGFEFSYGDSGYIIVDQSKTYYYVCTPHLPSMKARIIVN